MKSIVWAVMVLAFVVSSCAPSVPAGYSQQAQRAANASQLLHELTALGQTVQNLNALPAGSPGRLSDADTAAVRDGSFVINDAIPGYVASGVKQGIVDGFASLNANLSTNAKVSPTVKAALALVNTAIQLLAGGQ